MPYQPCAFPPSLIQIQYFAHSAFRSSGLAETSRASNALRSNPYAEETV